MYVKKFNARDAADLPAATTIGTRWIPCFGARYVVFAWSATNGNTPVNAGNQVEAINNDPLATAGTPFTITPGNLNNPNPAIITFPLNNAAGPVHCIVAPSATANLILQRAIRMNVTGHATLVITGLACTAYVVYDGDREPSGVGFTPEVGV